MSTAQHLATIELLRSRSFPRQRGPSGVGTSGPGYHLVELLAGEAEEPGTDGEQADDQADDQAGAEHDALAAILTARFGEPRQVGLLGARIRLERGEEIPPPWYELSAGPGYAQLWRIQGRWLALALEEGDGERPARLLAAVTETDPP
jgi:hypothetical protein